MTMFNHQSLAGIKLQPIVELKTDSIIGYEVLSYFTDDVDSEYYFQHAPENILISIFNQQVKQVASNPTGYHYFINLSVRDLLSTELENKIQVSSAQKLVIELQDPENLVGLNDMEKTQLVRNLEWLREHHIAVWLDDLDEPLLSTVCALNFCFDGIKIDKYAFWRTQFSPLELNQLVKRCYQITSNVLIEGIETLQHRDIAARSGASHLQGYLWPETIIQ
ncbi:EAL domain-containing protein [Obesumbacterium proteus]|uniref:EAL domain-containing protein n=1 Tax=Obesumbacterium proteus TaxID=82983 RepID=UPI001034B053|nr:EAL domain-containing protein [Obesumbacterium proteus]TBL73141.1 EAL domain-containing protein [Obesumbacterium proteus]